MKILFEHKGILPIKRYGGTERILFWHMRELVRRGHRVVLISHPKSDVSEYGIDLIERTSDDWRPLIPKDIDIVHLFSPTKLKIQLPCLLTVHGNGQLGEVFPKNAVFVSKRHAENHGSSEFVYNGIDLSEYPFHGRNRRAWRDFLFLAKARWKVKNLRDCIRACKLNKKHLHIAGGRTLSFSKYIHYYGMVEHKRKISLLQKTDVLLFPVRWHEPFGIAVIEAMSQGLPVVGSPYGSLPELVQPNVGFICKDFKEFKDVVARGENNFNPNEIRQYVEERFSVTKMTDRYLSYYEKVLNNETINRENPKLTLKQPPETILPF